jgi:hypothetical protein
MALVRLSPRHSAYLERTARRLSTRKGRTIQPQEILSAILDLAIQDEGTYDPADVSRPLDPLRRGFLQAETAARTASFAADSLLPAESESLRPSEHLPQDRNAR